MRREPDFDALLRGVARGDEAARKQVVTILGPRIRVMVAARLGLDCGFAEDVCQEVSLALFEGLCRLEAPTTRAVSAYLSAIVRNKVADALGRERTATPRPEVRSRADLEPDASSLVLFATIRGSDRTPSSQVARQEIFRLLLGELDGLGPRQRTAVTLAFFDHLNTTQIGEVMDLNRTAAAQLLARGIRQMQDRWRRRNQGELQP